MNINEIKNILTLSPKVKDNQETKFEQLDGQIFTPIKSSYRSNNVKSNLINTYKYSTQNSKKKSTVNYDLKDILPKKGQLQVNKLKKLSSIKLKSRY